MFIQPSGKYSKNVYTDVPFQNFTCPAIGKTVDFQGIGRAIRGTKKGIVCQNTIKQLKMGNIYTVGGGTALCKQSYVTLCRYIKGIKLFGTNSRFLFSQYKMRLKVAALSILYVQ